MPKEGRKRGRRAEAQRKKDKESNESHESSHLDESHDNVPNEEQSFQSFEVDSSEIDSVQQNSQMPFFGLVDNQELEYFKQAESTLSVDGFGSGEERKGFIAGVIEEAKGKELKLVTNQICSKLIERLILQSSDLQLGDFFRSFNGHFVALSHHKYSSHCIETLLVRVAAVVEREMDPTFIPETNSSVPYASSETLFLYMINEIKPEIKELALDQYGSHVVRLVLLILSGKTLPSSKSNSSLRSKRSRIARKMIDIKDTEDFQRSYKVPDSFKRALDELLLELVQGHTTSSARELAIHKVGSPVAQIIVELETKNKQRPFVSLLFPSSDSSEEAFVEYLLSDPVGSHFLQSVTEFLPLATIQRLYNGYMASRIDKLAGRDSGKFVVQALLQRLQPPQVKEILDILIPEIPQKDFGILQSVVDAAVKYNYKIDEVNNNVLEKYQSKNQPSKLLENLLDLESTLGGNFKADGIVSQEMQTSLLLQSLVKASPVILNIVIEGLISLPKSRLLEICKHNIFSHVVDQSLQASVNIVERRKLLNILCGSYAELAANAYGSHIVDKCWSFCYKLKFLRERIAEEIVKNAEAVKVTVYGRSVWKNWALDKYMRKRHDWWTAVKAAEDEISTELGLPNQVPAKQSRSSFKKAPGYQRPAPYSIGSRAIN